MVKILYVPVKPHFSFLGIAAEMKFSVYIKTSELGCSLLISIRHTMKNNAFFNLPFFSYLKNGRQPLTTLIA